MSDHPEKHTTRRVIRFALMLSVVCSLLITASAVGLKEFQATNMELDRRVNVLRAVNLMPDKRPSRDRINALYTASIREIRVDADGNQLETHAPGAMTLYLYQEEEDIKGYIIPINTRGLWGKIQGYLAFENDGQTVSGFSVFSHSETPGLGGEIESAWFQRNFQGKKILNAGGEFVSIGIARGSTRDLPGDLQTHYVDGISGATLTGKYLAEGIKETLTRYSAVSVSFRQRNLKSVTPP